jgi:hypothetical protein
MDAYIVGSLKSLEVGIIECLTNYLEEEEEEEEEGCFVVIGK